jgi:hypothetical protein
MEDGIKSLGLNLEEGYYLLAGWLAGWLAE